MPSKNAEWLYNNRLKKKLSGICIYCTQPANETSFFCDKHEADEKARQLLHRKRKSYAKNCIRSLEAATGTKGWSYAFISGTKIQITGP